MTDRDINTLLKNNTIVIYDGVCGFCNSSIQFILNQKPSKTLKFVSFQSELGTQIRTELQINEDMDSIIVVDNDEYSTKSKAIFSILNHIQTNWKYLRYFSFLPQRLSNFVYDIIARNRYRIKKNECVILTMEERAFFV